MGIFHRYDTCRGLTLFRWGQFNVEVWWCPPGYEIIRHSHPDEHIELVPLWGRGAKFHRQEHEAARVESVEVTWKRIGRQHSVPQGWIHWFTVSKRRALVFLNLSWWRAGVKPTSASIDFKPTGGGR